MLRSILCVSLCAFLSPSAQADDAEDKAVALVEKLGGKVRRDETLAGNLSFGRHWLRWRPTRI